MPLAEQHTIGPEKVSVTIFRKTAGDLLAGQISFERWYATTEEADEALTHVLRVLADGAREDGQ